MRTAWLLVRETFADWLEDRCSRLAAALAYYTVFSIAPLLIVAIAIAGAVFGAEAARSAVGREIERLVGTQSARAIGEMIEGARRESSGLIPTLLGLGALLFGASGVFAELQGALNTIWEVQPKPGRGLLGLLRSRFLSFTMVLGTGFLLLVSLLLTAGLSAFGKYLSGAAPGGEAVWLVGDHLISIGGVTLLIALIYKYLPDVEIEWRDVWIGAAATGVLFAAGKLVIGLYLGRSALGSAYGAAGALVVVLVWVYYTAQILFLGAEFTQVYARRLGSRIVPSEGAEPIAEAPRPPGGVAPPKRA